MKQWTTINKTGWGEGPWQHEPDKVSWTDEATGLPCLIVRNHRGALCGYVGVDETHPWFEVGYYGTDEHPIDVEVHGGLTFAEHCMPGEDESTGICHVPDPGKSDHVWWFGFDCAQPMDYSPNDPSDSLFDLLTSFADAIGRGVEGAGYRDLGYVRREVTGLARQLAEAAV